MTTDTLLRNRSCLTLPNDLGYLQTALGFVRNVAHLHGFSDSGRRRIELAVERDRKSNPTQRGIHSQPALVNPLVTASRRLQTTSGTFGFNNKADTHP